MDLSVTIEPSDALRSVVPMLRSWRYPEELPLGLPPLRSILMEVQGHMTPMGPKAAAILVERLFTVLPRPEDDALAFWLEIAGRYPFWAVKTAVDTLIETYRWHKPPLPGDLTATIESDLVYARRLHMLAKIRSAEMKQRHDRMDQAQIAGPRPVRSIEQQTAEVIRRAAATMALPPPMPKMTEQEFQERRQRMLDEMERHGMLDRAGNPVDQS